MHKIDQCEGGLQLADIATNNVGANDVDTRMKYIILMLENWQITPVQEGLQDVGQFMEQQFYITRLD